MKKNSQSLISKICVSGVLAAVCFVLDYFATGISLTLFGNAIKISISGLPIMLAAFLAGPLFGAATGFIGAMLTQLLTYGFTATTLLWVLPATARGLVIGLLFLAFKKSTKSYVLIFETVVSSLLVTALNTLALFVDSKINHYYSFEFIVGGIGLRVVTGIITAVILSLICVPIVKIVKKNTLFS